MADVNVNAPAGQAPTMAPPMRTDDQILPHIRWVPIGKSNCYLDVEKSFGIQSDMTSQLGATVNDNQAFTSPPSSDALINFVNKLGYPKLVKNLSNVVTNDMFQPWRALTTIINLCLTGKTSRFERPRALRKHKFHPRPDSLLHLPNEEPVLGYLKFNAKGTKREVFRMPIPGSLITADIQEALYYQEYLAKVAKHQRYLAGKTGSDPDSPAPKPTKPTRKPKSTAPKAPPRPSVSKPFSSTQPEPKSAPPKTQVKKCKLTTEISDKPSKSIKSRHGFVSKKRKPISTLRSMDESVAEDVHAKEPHVGAEETDMQRALEESLKSMYDVPRGPLPPVVIREPKSGKYQPLPEVPRKGKQRRTSTPTGSSRHDESSSLCAEHGLTDSKEDSKGAGPNPGAQDEGQAGSNSDEQAEGQAGPNPGNVEESQHMPSLVVHAGSDREHMDLDVVDVSSQPSPEQMDEGSSETLSSLQHHTKDLSFGDLFFNDKPSKVNNDNATAKTEAESMVSVTIQQDMSSIPPMTTPTIDLTSRPESPKVHQLKATATETTTTTTTTLLPLPYQQQQITIEAMMMKRIGEYEHIIANLIQENKGLEQRLDSHGA
nr:E-beta-farnesene synthase [Tanacetum cinerariifolium]